MPTRVTPHGFGVSPAALPQLITSPPTTEHPRRAFTAVIMGLPISVHVRGPDARTNRVAELVETAFAELRYDDRLFSTYRADSAVSRIRRGELTVRGAGARVRRVAALCEMAAERTDGAFSAWRPGPEGRANFDPSGLVKGWSVEQAFDRLTQRLRRLHEASRLDLLISAGGDVVCACERTDTPDWVVGVEDPRDRTRVLLRVPMRCGAVATSGTAARGLHIVDPSSGTPAVELLSATVVGPSLTWADVYATAAMVKGRLAEEWIATLSRHAGFIVDAGGATHVISGSG
jgi:thiamine biosynthesis lipoprotein